MATKKTTKPLVLSTSLVAPPAPTLLDCRFYKTKAGNEPVREWLKKLSKDVRNEVGTDLRMVQQGWPVGPPLTDSFGDGLWEVRTSLDGNIYRVLFCITNSVIVCLHGFTKKTKKTTDQDIALARKRQREEDES